MPFFTRPLVAAACALAQPLVVLPLVAAPAPALASTHAGSADAQAMLARAVAELQGIGPARAFAEFNAQQGPFHDKDLYVFVFSLDGRYEASGADPRLVGTSVAEMTDAEGTPLVRQMMTLANAKGAGRVDYVWLNRNDNRVEHKRSLVQRVGNHIVGVGYYAG